MYRITAGVTLLSLSVATLGGCVESREENSRSVLLCTGEEMKGAASPATADSSATATSRPAVLFVAYVATPPDVVDAMLKVARVTRSDVICDLGCGDGRILVTAARRYGCRAVGYDLDRLRVQEARKKAEDNRVGHLVRVEQKDILRVDLTEATVVTLYLGPELNARLIPQLARLGAGVRIVSHDFGLEDIPPDKVVDVNSGTDRRVHKVCLWNCPLKTARPTSQPTP
jgi:SAM-dependent methyltransferase